MQLQLHSLAYPVTALGPGRRVALWAAGCRLRCPGCITPQLLDSRSGKSVEIGRLVRHLLKIDLALDGITLSGGEPFDQAGALAELLDRLLPEQPQWNVVAFSGYRLERLRRMGAEACALLDRVDVLIDGPYVQRRPADHPLAGSGNQGVRLLSARGKALRTSIDALLFDQGNLGIGTSGQHMLIGVVSPGGRRDLHHALAIGPEERGEVTND